MSAIPDDLMAALTRHHQQHVLQGWDALAEPQRRELLAQLKAVDLEQVAKLYAKRSTPDAVPTADRLRPIAPESPADVPRETVSLGRDALTRGEVAVLLVAGGQGSRLGFDKPKGMFPIGPVSGRTLFQIHADKVFALGRRHGKPVPFLVMTSPATDAETREYFESEKFFGLDPKDVTFFQQGTMPAVDIDTGKLLLEAPGRLFTSPNGHGGTLTALDDSGLLDTLAARGVKHLFYFQVDNPLVKIADPAFLGRHLQLRSEASSKAIAKTHAKEKMGVFAVIDGRCGIVEYSDLPDELANATTNGQLQYRAGSPAIHLFDLEFLRRITRGADRLPFHIAKKKVPHVNAAGEAVNPKTENALKFEMFVFDALPMADRWLVMESPREEEFAPVKNADGADSPATCKAALSDLAKHWLRNAGVTVLGSVPVEVSPRFALDAAELAARVAPGQTVGSPTVWE